MIPSQTSSSEPPTHVNLDIKVDFPTDGNPTNPTLAIPVLATSNPIPGPPPPPDGVMSSRLSLASLAVQYQQRPQNDRPQVIMHLSAVPDGICMISLSLNLTVRSLNEAHSVFLFFCVLDISSSISLIFCAVVILYSALAVV